MFGITDPGIYWAYLLVILCVIFAIVFGIINWNKGRLTDKKTIRKDVEWEKEENLIKNQEA